MKSKIGKYIKAALKVILIPILFVVTYFIVSVSLSLIPVGNFPEKNEKIEIYLSTNGLHTDFILPLKNEIINWDSLINPSDYSAYLNRTPNFISFGWGEKEFYLAGEEIADLPYSAFFNALFLFSESVMHVSLITAKPMIYANTIKVAISEEQYKILIRFITESFQMDNGKPILIPGENYLSNDNFYEGVGYYSLFYTCNTWVNDGLKKMNVKTSCWTPFDQGIFYHLE